MTFFIGFIRVPKRKLKEYFEFYDQKYQRVLKYLSVSWLSLERYISRATLNFTSLKSYFLSEGFSDKRFQRSEEKFTDPLLEPVLLFLSSALPLFTHFNQLLQRDEPTIHILRSAVEGLKKKVAKCITLPNKVREVSSISEIYLNHPQNFMDTQDIYLGVLTKNMLKKFLDQDDILQKQYKELHDAVHYYFKSALEYIQKNISFG